MSIPLYGTKEAGEAVVVRCARGHLANRTTFEDVGGCPYCLHTPGERVAALAAMKAQERRWKREGRNP